LDDCSIILQHRARLLRALFVQDKENIMEERYMPPPFGGGRWTISREIHGRWIALIERAPMETLEDIDTILQTLKIHPSEETRAYYFPKNNMSDPCPTLELIELFSRIGARIEKEHGV
jgi:hypothetical protein